MTIQYYSSNKRINKCLVVKLIHLLLNKVKRELEFLNASNALASEIKLRFVATWWSK